MGPIELDLNVHSWKGGNFIDSFCCLGKEDDENIQTQNEHNGKEVASTTFIKFPIKWLNIWSKKEVGFMCATWNKAITMNVWRMRMNGSINQVWLLCEKGDELIIHRFWECELAYHAWEFKWVAFKYVMYGSSSNKLITQM